MQPKALSNIKPQTSDPISCWIVTEGMAGTENQCLGITDALGLEPIVKRIKLRSPWKELSPYLRLGNKFAVSPEGDQISAPWPDLLIASGRKSIAVSLAIKKASKGKTFTVQIQDPRVSSKLFDLVVVPKHDPTRGENVLVTDLALHRVTQQITLQESIKFRHKLSKLPSPRIAALIGGNSKVHELTPGIMGDVAELLENLSKKYGAGLMVTASRRTGEDNEAILRARLKGLPVEFWDGTGDNPYFAYLGMADSIIVTCDSVTMVSEAISTGKPVYVVDLEGGSPRFQKFYETLMEKGYTREFKGELENWTYTPPNDTLKVAQEIINRLNIHQQKFIQTRGKRK